jgi:DNA-binding NtrC family response regulator
MVRWFVEQFGGGIQLDSTVGKGTTVSLYLPRSSDRTFEVNDKTMPLSTLPTGTERVLVLAPDEAVRSTMKQILEVLGYTVDVTAGEEEMLAAAAAHAPDLVILDGPARDDAGLLERLRAPGGTPKIIVTIEGQRAQAPGAAAPGLTPLVKPFTLADLASSVRRTLDGKPPKPAQRGG